MTRHVVSRHEPVATGDWHAVERRLHPRHVVTRTVVDGPTDQDQRLRRIDPDGLEEALPAAVRKITRKVDLT